MPINVSNFRSPYIDIILGNNLPQLPNIHSRQHITITEAAKAIQSQMPMSYNFGVMLPAQRRQQSSNFYIAPAPYTSGTMFNNPFWGMSGAQRAAIAQLLHRYAANPNLSLWQPNVGIMGQGPVGGHVSPRQMNTGVSLSPGQYTFNDWVIGT